MEQQVRVARSVRDIWLELEVELLVIHHGDCVGADKQFHGICLSVAEELKKPIKTFGHPCNINSKRAHCKFDFTMPVKQPLSRNRDIVDAVVYIIFAPKEYEEILRSGTWATYRYCRLRGLNYEVILPNGAVGL